MTYLELINELRAQVGDKKRQVHVDWTGDGSTTIYTMPDDTFPILDDDATYTVRVNSVIQTEGSDYSLDKRTGVITFSTAPTNGHSVDVDAVAVYLLNEDWITVINATIRSMGDDFWKEFVDTDNLTTTANMLSLDLTSSHPNCIAVYDFQHRINTSDDWTVVEKYTNWRYDRDNNILYIADQDTFTVTGELLRVRGLETYTLGDETTDDIDVQNRFLTIVEYGCISRYWKWRYKDVVELVSKMTTESSRTPLQELIMLSDRFERLFELEKARLKPTKPAYFIPSFKNGKGRP